MTETINKKPTQQEIKMLMGEGKTIDVTLVEFVQDLGEGEFYIDEDMCMDSSVSLNLIKDDRELASCYVLKEFEIELEEFLSKYSKAKKEKLFMRDLITDMIYLNEQALRKKILGHTATLFYPMECSIVDSSVTMGDMMDAMAGRKVEEKPPVYSIEGLGIILEDKLCDTLGVERGEAFYEFSIPWLLLQEVFG